MFNIPAQPFYVLRHGQSYANAQGKQAGGEWNTRLTKTGIAQAIACREIFSLLHPAPVEIVSSTMSRAFHTATLLNHEKKLPLISEPRLIEQRCGQWSRKLHKEIQPLIRDRQCPPGGETYHQFNLRVHEAITDHLTRRGPNILFVCHGGVIRSIPDGYGVLMHGFDNCKFYRFEPGSDPEFPWTIWEAGIEKGRVTRTRKLPDRLPAPALSL